VPVVARGSSSRGRKAVPGVTAVMGARLLSPTRVAIGVAGSSNCPQLPASLSVQDRHTISIHLVTYAPPNGVCLLDLSVGIPVVVAINPTQIDVHHRLTLRLYYDNNPIVRVAPAL
jgi:hypothetical protein